MADITTRFELHSDADADPQWLAIVRELAGGEWLAAYYFEPVNGVPAIAEVRIVPTPQTDEEQFGLIYALRERHTSVTPPGSVPGRRPHPSRPLSARTIGSARPQQALTKWLERTAAALDRRSAQPAPAWMTNAEGLRYRNTGPFGLSRDELAAEPNRPGRPGRGDRFYAEVADAYLKAVARGSKTPVRDVADAMGEGYSTNYVRDTLRRARDAKHDILKSHGRGQAGGELTERGRRALEGP